MQQKEFIQSLRQLIAFRSEKTEPEEQKKCLDWIKEKFGQNLHSRLYEKEGKLSLILSNTQEKHFEVLLNGHIDVVPATSPEQYDLTEKNDIIYGRGVFDMKGPLLAALYAFFEHLKNNPTNSIGIIINSDEEIDGTRGAKALLQEENYSADFTILPDGGSDFDIVTLQKGLYQFRTVLKGSAGHAAYPWKGNEAQQKLGKIISAIHKLYPIPDRPTRQTTCTLSTIKGGSARNSTMSQIEATWDCRYQQHKDKTHLENTIKNYLTSSDTFEEMLHTPPFQVSENHYGIQKFQKITKQLIGKTSDLAFEAGSCDAVYFSEQNIPALITRPQGGGDHSANEWLEAKQVTQFYQAIHQLLQVTENRA